MDRKLYLRLTAFTEADISRTTGIMPFPDSRQDMAGLANGVRAYTAEQVESELNNVSRAGTMMRVGDMIQCKCGEMSRSIEPAGIRGVVTKDGEAGLSMYDVPNGIRMGQRGYFGRCNSHHPMVKMNGGFCEPHIVQSRWLQTYPHIKAEGREVVLNDKSFLVCCFGGMIGSDESISRFDRGDLRWDEMMLGSPAYMNELERFLDDYLSNEGRSYGPNAYKMIALEGIKKIMKDVNNYGDTSAIPDDLWKNLCSGLNGFVVQYGGVYPELHYFRNKLNRAPESLDDLIQINQNLPSDEKWELMSVGDSMYHMYGENGGYNLKFVSADGMFEAVYDKEGVLLTEANDAVNMGTYNYCSPDNGVGHVVFDVLPYFSGGNAPGTPLPKLYEKENLDRGNHPYAMDHRLAIEVKLNETNE